MLFAFQTRFIYLYIKKYFSTNREFLFNWLDYLNKIYLKRLIGDFVRSFYSIIPDAKGKSLFSENSFRSGKSQIFKSIFKYKFNQKGFYKSNGNFADYFSIMKITRI